MLPGKLYTRRQLQQAPWPGRLRRPTRYFTFHCTGLEAYSLLRDELSERVRYLNAGAKAEV